MNQCRMPQRKRSNLGVVFAIVLMLAPFGSAHAYIGPGLGLGTIMIILGFLGSLLLAVFSVFWYPIKRVFRKRRAAVPVESEETPGDGVHPEPRLAGRNGVRA